MNCRWEAICFCLEKHSFEKKLQSILSAAAQFTNQTRCLSALTKIRCSQKKETRFARSL